MERSGQTVLTRRAEESLSVARVNWSPSESWELRVGEFSADWSDPLSVFGHWAQLARECYLPAVRKIDFQDNLQDLLRLRRQHLDPDWRRQVNRAIYRTRRKRKRFVRYQALKDACAAGRAPPAQSKGGHVNWGRLFGNVSPAEALTSHYSAIFEFYSLEEAAQESVARQSVMQNWFSRPVGTNEFVCDLPRLQRALNRLHLGKSSPDGLTAEVLRQLPGDELSKMAATIPDMFRSLSFEAKLDCHHGFVDPEESSNEVFVRHAPNLRLVSFSQVAGVSLDGCTSASAVEGAPSWFRARSSAC